MLTYTKGSAFKWYNTSKKGKSNGKYKNLEQELRAV